MKTLLGGDVHEHRVAAVLLGNQTVLGELATDLVRVGALLVDLVDRHDDRHVGRLGVVEGLNGLRHDAVVSRHDEDGDVGHLGAAGTHGREGLVTGGVDEGDRTLLVVQVDAHLVGTDGLGDAPGLTSDDVGGADGVQQLGLTVVDVPHDRDHRGPGHEVGVVLVRLKVDVEGLQELAVLVLGRDDLDVVAQLGAQEGEGVLVEGLGGRGHLTEVEQHGHQGRGVGVDLLGQVRERRALAHTHRGGAVTARDDDTADRRRALLLELLALGPLGLASPRGAATAPEGALGGTATAAATAGSAEAARTTAATGTTAAATGTRATATAAGTASCGGTGAPDGGLAGHHARVGTRTARTRGTGAAGSLRPCAALRTGAARARTALRTGATGTTRAGHALGGGEGVVAGARRTRAGLARALASSACLTALARHALGGGEGVVAGARRTGAGPRSRGVAARAGRRGARGGRRLGCAGSGLGGLGCLSSSTRLGRRLGGGRRGRSGVTRLGGLSPWLGCAGSRLGGGRLGGRARSLVLSTGGSRLGSPCSRLGGALGGLGGLRVGLGRLVGLGVRRRFLHLGGEVLANPASDGRLNG